MAKVTIYRGVDGRPAWATLEWPAGVHDDEMLQLSEKLGSAIREGHVVLSFTDFEIEVV